MSTIAPSVKTVIVTDLLKAKFVWSALCQLALENVKLCAAPASAFLCSLSCPNRQLMRWTMFLQTHGLDIRHIGIGRHRGKDDVVADALSRK